MQPLPMDLSRDDTWQWLNNGWFWYDDDGEGLLPCYLSQDDRDADYVVTDADGRSHVFEQSRVYIHWPACGAINMDGFALYVQREQTRQYRRTYNKRCIKLDIPRKWDVMKRHSWVRSINPDTPALVAATFTPKYYNYSAAVSKLGDHRGWVSVALNPYLVLAGEVDSHMVYYRGKLLARVEDTVLVPLDDSNPRNRRILKYFDGRVRYANQ